MTRYLDLITALAEQIADGQLRSGAALPSLRELARELATTPSTAARAYRELAAAGVIVVEPRRSAKVAPNGALAARGLLRGIVPFRLAGSDDPALSLLTPEVADSITLVGATGSYRGLTALWSGQADGAALHLRHRSGEYNAPFARALLSGRRPVLVHLWTRQQGFIVAQGNPKQIERAADLAAVRVARRPRGTGTRALHDRLLLDAGVDPEQVSGPEVDLHLDVAIAVATGEADAGLGLLGSARCFDLDFVPITEEPFQIITTEEGTGGLQPLLRALANPALTTQIERLGGYDLAGAGQVLAQPDHRRA